VLDLDDNGSGVLVGDEGAGVEGILLQEPTHYLEIGEQFSLPANCSSAISHLTMDKMICCTEAKKVPCLQV
jgi:hypothetical protein